jgi:hypothetical protein
MGKFMAVVLVERQFVEGLPQTDVQRHVQTVIQTHPQQLQQQDIHD